MKTGKVAEKNLERFRDTFEKWQKENEKKGWERIEPDDDYLIGLALECAIDYYGGDGNV